MKLNLGYLSGLLLIAALSTQVWSFPSPHQPHIKIAGKREHIAGKRERKEQEIFKSLNLSGSQVTRMREIRKKYENRIDRREKSLKQANQELRVLMAGSASSAQIRAKYNQVQNLHNQLGDLRLESLLEMRAVLTPSQRRKLAEIMGKKGFIRPPR
jgi:periplasmic protein CpxP/Spy